MFLAIVNETYNHVKETMNEDTKQNVCKFLKAGFRRMFCRELPTELLIQSINGNEEDEAQKLKNLKQAFKNLNFTEREIDLFLSKYEIMDKKELDEADTERILTGIYSEFDKDDKNKMVLTKKHYDRLCTLEEHVVMLNEKFDKYVKEMSKVIKRKKEERFRKEIEERNRQRDEEKKRQNVETD